MSFCPICIDTIITDEYTLSKCNHVFCKEHIFKHIRTKYDLEEEIGCPICRHPCTDDEISDALIIELLFTAVRQRNIGERVNTSINPLGSIPVTRINCDDTTKRLTYKSHTEAAKANFIRVDILRELSKRDTLESMYNNHYWSRIPDITIQHSHPIV